MSITWLGLSRARGRARDREGREPLSLIQPAQWILVLIAVTLIIRMIGAGSIGLGTGEAYYVSSARQLHLGYFDQPPLSLWIVWATMAATGNEAPWLLRLPFVLMFAASTGLIYWLGARLRSPLAGLFSALILNASLLFPLSIGSWIQPDAPMVLCWVATCCCLVQIFAGKGAERPFTWWSLAGLCLGGTALAKYHVIFLVLGAGGFMLLDRRARQWLLHPAPYLGLGIALVLFSPVLIWNAENHWASFAFQGGRALAGESLDWVGLLRMLIGVLLYITPWIAVPALYVGVRTLLGVPAGWTRSSMRPAANLLAIIGLPPIVFFTLVALWSDTQFHFHWQAPGFLTLFPLLGAWAARHFERHAKTIGAWLAGSLALSTLVITLLLSHASTGWGRAMLPGAWEDPTAAFLPWTEVGEALATRGAFAAPRTFVAGMNWIDCGYIDTQLAGRAPLACLGPEPRNIAFNIELAHLDGWTGYIVARTDNPAAVVGYLAPLFESFEMLETASIRRSGVPEIDNLHIFRGAGFNLYRGVEGIGTSALRVMQLPRTAIIRLEGAIANASSARIVSLKMGDRHLGTIPLQAEAETRFVLDVPPEWGVGMRETKLEIVDPAQGSAIFTSVSVSRK